MPAGQRPIKRFICKNADDTNWTEIATEWAHASDKTTLRINLEAAQQFANGGVVRCLGVVNQPRAANDTAANTNGKQNTRPATKRAGPPDRRPAA